MANNQQGSSGSGKKDQSQGPKANLVKPAPEKNASRSYSSESDGDIGDNVQEKIHRENMDFDQDVRDTNLH